MNWFKRGPAPKREPTQPHRRRAIAHAEVKAATPPAGTTSESVLVDLEPPFDGHIESLGPGKNVLVRNKYVREDTGTHETLKIIDDTFIDSGDEDGIDPYNSGQFDRSKNWDKRFRN